MSSEINRLPRNDSGHVTGDHPLREALDDGGLADAGFADQHRVVLGPPGQHLDHSADFRVPPDDRVDLALAGALGEVDAVLLQRLVAALRVLRGDLAVAAADHGERLDQRLRGCAETGQHVADVGAGAGQRGQQVLGGQELVTGGPHDLLGAR